MTSAILRYQSIGPTDSELASQLPGGITATVTKDIPIRFLDIDISNVEGGQADLDSYLLSIGYEFVETNPQISSAKMVFQVTGSTLGLDSSSIVPANGWVDVLNATLSSKGGTTLNVTWGIAATVAIGGGARVLISGGDFGSGTRVGFGGRFTVLGGSVIHLSSGVPLPVTTNYTTYTITIQARAVGLLSSVTVNAASNPDENGARIGLVEYA